MEKENKIYVLTETDSSDYRWCYNETFYSRKKAVERMKKLYHENVVKRGGNVIKAEYNAEDGKASAEFGNNLFVSWNVKECEIQ